MFYFITSLLSTNHPTRLCHSDHFKIQINPYSSQYLPPRIHNLSLQPPLQHLLLYLLPHLFLNNLTLTTLSKSFTLTLETPSKTLITTSTPFLWNFLINITSKIQTGKEKSKTGIYKCTNCKPRCKSWRGNQKTGAALVTHLWTSIFWRELCEKIPNQDLSIQSNFWKTTRRIDRVRGKTAHVIKQVIVRTY